MNPIEKSLAGEAELAARYPGQLPEGVKYHYNLGGERLHVTTYCGVEISMGDLKKKFGIPESECFFCHYGVADIHSASRAARAAREG